MVPAVFAALSNILLTEATLLEREDIFSDDLNARDVLAILSYSGGDLILDNRE